MPGRGFSSARLCLDGIEFCLQIAVRNQMTGTLFCTLRAAYTLGIVDHRHIIHHMNGIVLAGALTNLTADTADIAELPQCRTLLLRGAGHHDT